MVLVDSDVRITAFSPGMKAALKARPKDTITFRTLDCWAGKLSPGSSDIDSMDFDELNPATGPVEIEGAEPGDTLVVEILSIRPAETGAVSVIPGAGVLGGQIGSSSTRFTRIEGGFVEFLGFKVPADPMIGVIGVATADEDGPLSTGIPGRHGGNMDTKDIKAGSVLYLPVFQHGAMLALGDIHAAMADGEVCVTGCEAQAEVVVRPSLIKSFSLDWPAVESDGSLMLIVSGKTLDTAVEEATRQVVALLSSSLGISSEDAYMLTSLAVDMRISQCVDPLKTVRACVPPWLCEIAGFSLKAPRSEG